MFLFHKNERPVTSGSMDQPSRPMKEHSVNTNSKMHILLRIRPTFTKSKKERRSIVESYSVPDSSTLITKHPEFLVTKSNRAKRSKQVEDGNTRRFTFTRIFCSENDQKDFFDDGVKHRVIEFLNGQSSTLMCYGTSDSGKTYTLYGTPASPGIVTRSIEFIFSALNCTLTPWYTLTRHNEVVTLDEDNRAREIDVREKLLTCRAINREECRAIYKALEKSGSKNKSEFCKDAMYSLWISFVEIYNENVYDLLAVDEDGKNVQLKMSLDKDGMAYLQGANMVSATTGLEAFEVLVAGQSRLSVAPTGLGTKSSRSHSIFTIKLLKYVKDSLPGEVEIASMSFCDLAGSGRLQKALCSENWLKESRSINTSLLVLGRCFTVIAEGRSRQSMGPFRESKFTRLFQRALCGKENMTLIVNVNPLTEHFAETQNVLNFAVLAAKVGMEITKEPRKLLGCPSRTASPMSEVNTKAVDSNLHRAVSLPRQTSLFNLPENIVVPPLKFGALQDNVRDVKIVNEQLKHEIEELKSTRIKREYEVRQELADFYSKLMNDMDESWRKRINSMEEERENLLKLSVRQVKNFYKDKINTLSDRKPKRTDSGDYEDDNEMSSLDLQMEGDTSTNNSKVLSWKDSLDVSKDENEKLTPEKNQFACEMSIVRKWLAEMNSIIKPTTVSLPKLEDSGDFYQSCYKAQDVPLVDSLSTIKEALLEYQSSIRNLKSQMSIKSNALEESEELYNSSQRELMEIKTQLQDAENEKLELLDKIKKLEIENETKAGLPNFETLLLEAENSVTEISDFKRISSNSKENALDSLIDDCRLSFLESSLEKSDYSLQKSHGDCSSKNDSGIVTVDRGSSSSTSEKCSQTNLFYDAESNIEFQEMIDKLKQEYDKISSEHLATSNRATQLSQELDDLKDEMKTLRDSLKIKEQEIQEYNHELFLREEELNRLYKEKDEIENRRICLAGNLKIVTREYEEKLNDCEKKLKAWEDFEISKYLDYYLDKSANIEAQLSIANKELEKMSNRYLTDHIPQIERLENELQDKNAQIQELEEKLCQLKIDMSCVNELRARIQDFENIMERDQSEKDNLLGFLHQCSGTQSEIEDKLKRLTSRVQERDRDILLLKSELETALRTSAENNKVTKDLSTGIAESVSRITVMRREIMKSEETCNQLERISNKEFTHLSARLGVFEKNNELLNMMKNSNDNEHEKCSRQDEIDKLKQILSEKDRELDLFKKNRDSTIEKYESLVQHLQDNSDGEQREPSKLKRLFTRRQKYVLGDIKESVHVDVDDSEPKMHTWKAFEDDCTCSPSKCSISYTENFSSVPSTESVGSYDIPIGLEATPKRPLQTESRRRLQIVRPQLSRSCRHLHQTQSLRRLNSGSRESENDCMEIRRNERRMAYSCRLTGFDIESDAYDVL